MRKQINGDLMKLSLGLKYFILNSLR